MTKLLASALLLASTLAGCGVDTGAAPVRSLKARTAVQAASAPKNSPEAQLKRAFDLMDANGDGVLTFAEALAAPTGQPAGGWAPGERERQARETFARLDANRDGRVTFAELLRGNTGRPATR